jgi:para-aminobenzoate synthetase
VSLEDFRAAAASSPRMFWLERSVMGVLDDDDVSLTFDAARREVTRHESGRAEVVGDDVFAVLAEELARDEDDPDISWVGYLGYACRPDLPARPAQGVPDAVLLRTHRARTSYVSGPAVPASDGVGGETAAQGPVPGWYAEAFARVQSELHAGNSYEVNLTYREVVESSVDPVSAYLRLRAVNPASYAGYLQHHGVHLLSSSPECFATVDRGRTLEARPIKGTTPRGGTPEEDAAHAAHLRRDPKLRAENLMITDLLRNDLSMVCEVGSVHVPSLMEVESYPVVHQLVTTVRGRLREEVGTVEALRALFPAGSMTGAPKRRTMAIIDGVESSPRGVYAGAFGSLSADGRADLGVVIRSLVATDAGSGRWRYELGTGGGITVRSTVEAEWAESRWKASRLKTAVADQ